MLKSDSHQTMLLHLGIHYGGSVTEEMPKEISFKKKKNKNKEFTNAVLETAVSGVRTQRSGHPHVTLGHLSPMTSLHCLPMSFSHGPFGIYFRSNL